MWRGEEKDRDFLPKLILLKLFGRPHTDFIAFLARLHSLPYFSREGTFRAQTTQERHLSSSGLSSPFRGIATTSLPLFFSSQQIGQQQFGV